MKMQSLWLAGSVVFVAATAAALAQNMPKTEQAPAWQDSQPATPQGYSPETKSDSTSAGGLPMTGSQSSGPEATGKTRAQVLDELKRARDSGELKRLNEFYGYGGE
ncbi:hypothetical protein PTE30175_01708 [Pandoraea terrae]|uniref:DUF4148 domain-containing protein n=1 Tax=Pandoraea terrae TaxID=1537710 RepID=A0A5E4U7B3_9BURK|nr:DUF4148 domain-containing protein [Pandoraea terrae]VVD94099.1 hypothetical protein PTE30175_01708 [Pandoraea terrae]